MELTLTRRIVPFAERERPLEIGSFVAKTPFLPPAFELIPRLLLLLDDEDQNAELVAEVVHLDPSLTANILQIANCVSRGGYHKTDSLKDAIVRIGLREIFRIVTRIVTIPAFESGDVFAHHNIDLWRHSLCAAFSTQTLARDLAPEIDPELAYTAGLLHDIGKVVLAHAAGEDYFHMIAAAGDNCVPVHKAEHESFRITHLEAAGNLLRSWHFPARIVEAVVHHHNPFRTKDHARLAALIYFGDLLAYRLNHGAGPFPQVALEPDPDALNFLGLETNHLSVYEEEIHEHFRREQERLA